MSEVPIAFLSYVRFDDQHENGRLTALCKRLSGEVQIQTGEEFHIFQDQNDIEWGQQWQRRINESIDAVTFLVPIITPGFFKRPACRGELERFLDREKRLGRNDLILPVYYVTTKLLDDPAKREKDSLAQAIAARQRFDWRDLRFEPLVSPIVGKAIEQMAKQIVAALERNQPVVKTAPPSPSPPLTQENSPKMAQSSSGEQQEASAQISDVQRHPVQRTEPQIRVVDALYRGDHSSLRDALQAAKPGEKILVRPGLYQEGVVIEKPVEIIGDGDPGEVVIEARGETAVLFKATMGRITNLTLRQAGGGNWFCVDIAQGRLDLEGCDITSQSLACIAIHGGADPRIRSNRIHDGKAGGVFVWENGQGTIEDNDIFGNALSGVEIKEGGNLTLRRNRIHDGKQGVFVWENGQGTIEDNDIFGNALSSVEIKKGGNPTLRRNRIHDGKAGGVFVWENGQGTIEDNDIFGNALSGVEIRTGGNPRLRNNRIHDGKAGGVFVSENGQGTVEDNDIFGNAFSGVEIREGSNPTLRRNRIHDGKTAGVIVYQDGQGTLEDNEIFGNALSGVEIRTGGNPTLRRNRIQDGKGSGVFVNENAQGTIEDNEIFGNASAGVSISAGGNPSLRRNRIHDGKSCGVHVYNNGQGTIEDNEIFGNAKTGVEIKTGGNPTLRRNRISKNGYEAIYVHDGGCGVFEDNDLRGNEKGAWDIAPDCVDKVKRSRNQEK